MKPLLAKPVPFYARRSMAASVHNSDIYFWGGVGAKTKTESILDVSDELWRFDTSNMNWSEIKARDSWPSARRCVGWLGCEKGIYLWGGSGLKTDTKGQTTYNFLNDLWIFNPTDCAWQALESSDNHALGPYEHVVRPSPRYTPVFYVHNGQLFVFGGYTEDLLGKRKMNDLWIRNSGGVWREISSHGLRHGYRRENNWPGVRYGCMSAGHEERLYLCGGFSDEGDHIDMWEFNCSSGMWRILARDSNGENVPKKRYCAAMAVHGDSIYLFGGRSRRYPKQNFNDLWRFSLDLYRWEQISANTEVHNYDGSSESPGYHAKAAVCIFDNYMYLCGGEGLHGHVSDFWRLNMKTCRWELLQAARDDDPVFW